MAKPAGSSKLAEPTEQENGATRAPRIATDLSSGDSNVSPELLFLYIQKLTKATEVKDKAVADIRNLRKQAKGDGVDMKALDAAMTFYGMDDDKRFSYFRNLDAYMRYLRTPTGTQFGLFEAELPLPNDKAYADGKFAGQMGKSLSDNPHDMNTDAGQEWTRGYHDGQKSIIEKMGTVPGETAGEAPLN